MNIHFISIGGSVMHNLAICLHNMGHKVSGSDDEIYEPSKSRLKEIGLLPSQMGWDESRISNKIDAIILGMHAKEGNVELDKAIELKIPIYSYPAFIYKESKNKKRIVIAGSHGKTTTTSIILHVLSKLNYDFDYLVGASLEGFDQMVQLSNANLIIIEGDEYLSSAIDRIPKIHHYKPHIAVLTGIEWDHINVFPSESNYTAQFSKFLDLMPENSKLIYFHQDEKVRDIVSEKERKIRLIPYKGLERDEKDRVRLNTRLFSLLIFGNHNDQNLNAAMLVCEQLGISNELFLATVCDFKGARKRLQIISENPICFLDFAHAPSKVSATVRAFNQKYSHHKRIGFLELHTFSSMNKSFIPRYSNSLNGLDIAHVFCNEHSFTHKNMPVIEAEFIKTSFNRPDIQVIFKTQPLKKALLKYNHDESCAILIMSSGNLGGIDLNSIFT